MTEPDLTVSKGDQPRPDLDAAIDATVPSLTAVRDDAAAASLRRTRTVLAEPRGSSGVAAWRWAVPAAALVVAGLAAVAWWPVAPVEGPRVVVVDGLPPAPPAPLIAKTSPRVVVVPAPRTVRPTRLPRAARIEATSAPRADDTPRPNPLDALVRAVQEIPDDAWDRSVARAAVTLSVPPLVLEPIRVTPLQTPALTDTPPPESTAPGEA